MKRADVIGRIQHSHIERAIEELNKQNWVPKRRNSTKFSLHHKGRLYPPKYLIVIAGKLATGKTLTPDDHSGGEQDSNEVLRRLGFGTQIVRKRSRWPER
jgi:hypothetical protein